MFAFLQLPKSIQRIEVLIIIQLGDKLMKNQL
jgi:hypothetical protein